MFWSLSFSVKNHQEDGHWCCTRVAWRDTPIANHTWIAKARDTLRIIMTKFTVHSCFWHRFFLMTRCFLRRIDKANKSLYSSLEWQPWISSQFSSLQNCQTAETSQVGGVARWNSAGKRLQSWTESSLVLQYCPFDNQRASPALESACYTWELAVKSL